MRGERAIRDLLERAETVYVPFVVLAELRAGFRGGRKALANEQGLVRFLQRPGVEVLWPSEATTRIWAGLFLDLRTGGTPIPQNDLWIAALALEHDLVLASRDEHFRRLPQLPLV